MIIHVIDFFAFEVCRASKYSALFAEKRQLQALQHAQIGELIRLLPMLSFPSESAQICEPFFLRICKDRTTATQGQLQIFQEIFSKLLGKQCIAFLGFFNQYFS